LAGCDNYWVSCKRLTDKQGGGLNAIEAAVAALLPYVCDGLANQEWDGAEYWVQTYEAGRGLTFHFDKDEAAMEADGRMLNPILSSVLYLTGTPQGPLQGPTVITDQVFNHDLGCAVPENPTSSTLVFPAIGTYCTFAGNSGHGVLECSNAERRATLLVNWWKKCPERVRPAPENAFQSTLAAELEPGEVKSLRGEPVKSIEIEVCPPEVPPEEGYLMVDDLLAQRGVRLRSGDILVLRHVGLNLYPIDAEQLLAAEDKLQIGALLLVAEDEADGAVE
jgi:hypothetical protein